MTIMVNILCSPDGAACGAIRDNPENPDYAASGFIRATAYGWSFPSSSFTAIKLRVAISQHRECKACLARIYRGLGTSQGKPCTPFVINLMAVNLQLGNEGLEAPASGIKPSRSLQGKGSQAGAWEPVQLGVLR